MPKIVDHEQYRKELLAQSFDLFADKGYGNVTMRQMAKELGVSTGTLYHYFPSKEALFGQLVEELNQRDMLQFEAVIQGAITRRQKIVAAFQLLADKQEDLFKQNMTIADFYHQQSDQTRDEVLQQMWRKSFERIEAGIRHLLGLDDPELSQFVLAFVDGLIWQRVYGCEINFAQQGELLATMLEAYFVKQASS
jgi:AcrR family transcriptional regulator